jgi:hypothetical protein
MNIIYRVRPDISSGLTIEDELLMIEKYPAALKHRDVNGNLPIHVECEKLFRSAIISKCIELYPESLADRVINLITNKVNQSDFHLFSSILSIIFTFRPLLLYNFLIDLHRNSDIRLNSTNRCRILNLLPRHVFTQTHDADHRDLNWQSRVAMMMLLSQMKIQQQSEEQRPSILMLFVNLFGMIQRGISQNRDSQPNIMLDGNDDIISSSSSGAHMRHRRRYLFLRIVKE